MLECANACEKGDKEHLMNLIKSFHGIFDPNDLIRRGDKKTTMLHLAMENDRPEIIALLYDMFKFRLRPNVRDSDGCIPLHKCVGLKGAFIFCYLYGKIIDVCARDGRGKSVMDMIKNEDVKEFLLLFYPLHDF
jgi:hypothetical protein